jgi:hypothetical protein
MRNLFSLPFRFLRICRFALITVGALIIGLGLWLQIEGVPNGVEPAIAALRGLMTPVFDEQATIFGMFSKIGGVLALLGLLGMTIQNVAPTGTPNLTATPEPATPAASNAVSHSALQAQLVVETEPLPNVHPTRASQSFASGLRTGAIKAVICTFLMVLGATFLGSVGPGNTGQVVIAPGQTPAQAMIQGHLASAAINIAATGPSTTAFSIPTLDPADVVPWVQQQLARALSGDQAAMIKLGAIVGGIFILLVGIRIMFVARRGKTTRQTRAGRVSYG